MGEEGREFWDSRRGRAAGWASEAGAGSGRHRDLLRRRMQLIHGCVQERLAAAKLGAERATGGDGRPFHTSKTPGGVGRLTVHAAAPVTAKDPESTMEGVPAV